MGDKKRRGWKKRTSSSNCTGSYRNNEKFDTWIPQREGQRMEGSDYTSHVDVDSDVDSIDETVTSICIEVQRWSTMRGFYFRRSIVSTNRGSNGDVRRCCEGHEIGWESQQRRSCFLIADIENGKFRPKRRNMSKRHQIPKKNSEVHTACPRFSWTFWNCFLCAQSCMSHTSTAQAASSSF